MISTFYVQCAMPSDSFILNQFTGLVLEALCSHYTSFPSLCASQTDTPPGRNFQALRTYFSFNLLSSSNFTVPKSYWCKVIRFPIPINNSVVWTTAKKIRKKMYKISITELQGLWRLKKKVRLIMIFY